MRNDISLHPASSSAGPGSGPEGFEDLVFELLERSESEGPAVLDELCSAHPALAERLRSRVLLLKRAGLLAGGDEPGPHPDRLGDSEIPGRAP